MAILVVMTGLGLIAPDFASAASAGPRNPSAASNNTSIGSRSWSNTSNVYSSDGRDASATSLTSSTASNYLVATGFGFSIPSGSTITGIQVSVEKADGGTRSSAYIRDNSVKIVKGGSITGTEHADTLTNWPSSDGIATYGSSSDLWGQTWTVSDVNASNFGVAVSAKGSSSSSSETALIDNIQITVYYTTAAPPAEVAGSLVATPSYGSYVDSPFTITENFTSVNTVTSCQYRTSSGGSWYTATVSGTGPYTCTATGVTASNGSSLSIQMRATSSAGTSTPSATLSVTVDSASPSDGSSFSATAASYNQINLSWSAASDSGSGVAGYKLVRADNTSTAPSNCSGTAVYQGTALSYSDPGLTANTRYAYRVCAYDNLSNMSSGRTASATTQSIPAPAEVAGSLVATPSFGSYVDSPFTITENFTSINTVTSCQYRTTSGGSWYTATVSGTGPYTCTAAGVTASNGSSLSLQMRATSSSGTSTPSATLSMTVDSASPTDGSTFTATAASSSQINLSWLAATDSGSGVAGYKLVRATGATAPASCSGAAVYQGTALSYSDPGLAASTQYAYRVCAYDNVGNVSTGKTATATTQAASTCTANMPTVTITTLPKTITTVGGSVGYSFTVMNNDTGSGCSPVTYNLSAADSNTINFNPSTVSVASVSLSAGATSLPMVISVSGKAGQVSGTNSTTVTASATGHTNGTSSVTTTLNVVCTTSAPTLSITPGFQNITSDGGSVSYTVNVQNNDTAVACTSSTTFSLSVTDSNPGSYVVPSTLSQNSVTLAPGANTNVTLTVKAISGITSGTNSTSVNSASSAHDTGATSNSVSTSIVISGPCTANTPGLQISPSQTVTPGGTASYTISVTNNDTGGCTMTNFALNVVSDSNSTNFTTPSTINPSTLSLAPGASSTAFLVVTSMSTAPTNSSNTTTVSLTAAGHTAPANVSVTTTVVVPPPVPNTALLHNSTNTKSTKWSAQGGWGIPGGVYGQFICETCHAENTANIKRVKTPITVPDTSKGNILGSTVNFQSTTFPNGFGDDSDNHVSSTKPCEVCHTITAHHRYNTSQQTDGKNHFNNQDCTACHKHSKGFTGGDCIGCHSVQQGNRVAVASLFSGTSHHIQGVTLTNQMCYQCHWEANIDGSVNAIYHGGSANPGAPVRLVIYGAGTRPTTYTVGTTAVEYMSGGSAATLRTELVKINQHCLGCHSAQNSAIQPFGDGKTPNTYAWDSTKTSIAERYSQAGTTPWGKYSGAKTNMKSTLTKAFSAHGNAAANMRGWDNRPASTGGTGVDGTITNASGGVQVLCFDCHNSHGSTVSGTTTSYASATTNGGIFKDTTANLGGYKMTYKPQAEGSAAGKNVSNPGGSLCIDCHMTQTSGTTPWGWQDTFAATQAIMGYWEKPYWTGAAGTNPAGPQLRYPYKNLIGSKGGHFGGSSSLNTAPMGTINGLCTPCHDPHGVSPTLGANEAYGVPLLKGTWMTSPYREDVAPLSVTDIHAETGEHADRPAYTQASAPFYNIDQNTFDAGFTTTVGHLTVPTWNFNSTKRVTETADKFGGLCLNCHPKTSIAPGNNSAWKSMDRIHNSVAGWGTYGANTGNAIHSYTCSKCHTPHNSCLPRLLITNCLDFTHRGQIGNGGVAGGAGVRGENGSGIGEFPGGGGGRGENRSYAYFFGNSGSRYSGSGSNLQTCHDTTNSTTWPDNQRWNVKSPWGTQGTQPSPPTIPGH